MEGGEISWRGNRRSLLKRFAARGIVAAEKEGAVFCPADLRYGKLAVMAEAIPSEEKNQKVEGGGIFVCWEEKAWWVGACERCQFWEDGCQ
jgi:hypothetical protein